MSYQQWLQHVIQPVSFDENFDHYFIFVQYAFGSRVFYDVDQVLKAFPGLRPRTDNCSKLSL